MSVSLFGGLALELFIMWSKWSSRATITSSLWLPSTWSIMYHTRAQELEMTPMAEHTDTPQEVHRPEPDAQMASTLESEPL